MIVANRTLMLKDGERTIPIAITIFAPEKTAAGDWGCRYLIDWPERPSDKTIFGFDSIQALHGALQIVGAEIYSSDYHEAGNLFWEAPGKGYGFPVAPTLRDLLIGDDAKYF